ncbi:C6 zinc finger domain-containing protein [Verticillium alfalfae VaMs.102]|uniref:C6 zinc finger domain-containing protein n=1 Tax=Verticillium alfalfae (strain VaMs.102 / ATCC MYA-4576 / FGSC 10136) TaxID=526221 RepID=C9S878_VERA1|nr:C6 zinc finger domain-containing protein [Verticillium alfalfae VaMs.102]EEY15328.1 C6 zinc finger domain-containing protein [Verticillium alfalfae VaMs.102]
MRIYGQEVRLLRKRRSQPLVRLCTTNHHEPRLALASETFPRPQHTALVLRPTLPQRCPKETRSYRYFLDVAGPSLAGVFDVDFWLAELPRACHADPAIWHAVVCLGAAHETNALDFTVGSYPPQKIFALQQFSHAIRSLTERPPQRTDIWRALTISVIFTCVCKVQGLHSQARMHLASGRQLLEELQSCEEQQPAPRKATATGSTVPPQTSSSPINLAPLKDLLLNLEVFVYFKDNGDLIQAPELVASSKIFHLWRLYEAPLETPTDSRTARPLTVDNLTHALQAIESLFSALIYLRQQLVRQSSKTDPNIGDGDLDYFVAREAPYVRCFKQVRKAHDLFVKETIRSPEAQSVVPYKALLTLSLALAATRLIFVGDPELPDQSKRDEDLPRQYEYIVNLAERILKPDHRQHPPFAKSGTMQSALFAVAYMGKPQSVRRRAVQLMTQYPRQQGINNSLESASIANVIMAREQELLRRELVGLNGTSATGEVEDLEVPPLKRLFNYTIEYVGARSAIVKLHTWEEHTEGRPGEERTIHW